MTTVECGAIIFQALIMNSKNLSRYIWGEIFRKNSPHLPPEKNTAANPALYVKRK